MKTRILIAAAVVMALVIAVTLWRGAEQPRRKPLKIAKKKAARPAVPKPGRTARIAIVMDDFGYNMNNLDALFSINEPITLSILPRLNYSKRIAEKAGERGYEVILHLPLEPHSKDVREEVDTIRSGMSEKEIDERLAREIESVPALKGVSNHMGSKSTEDRALMAAIFRYLKRQRLYFFDSLTSERSVCRDVAKSVGLKYARRDVFLDNADNAEYIEKQLTALERIALRRGSAIGVCHDRKKTVTVLARMMPKMAEEGIEFVYLSEMVR